MMAASFASTAQEDCKPSTHLYIGGGIGGGTSVQHDGFVVALNTGIATRIVGIDVSMHAFPHPYAPAVFSGAITKPLFVGNTKITLGGGYAYSLVSNDDKSLNSFKYIGYMEVAKLFTYSGGAAITFRGSVTGTTFLFTVGMHGIFKKN